MTPSNDPLLQPFQLKHLTLKNRVMSTSHACGLEEDGGMPGDTYQRYHQEKARGGLALTMFGGSSYVAEDSTWASGQLNLGTDRVVPYLQSFAERIHGEGAAIMIQISHLGRRGETNTQNWLPTMAPSVVRETGHRSFPKEMDRHDIDRVVTAFGDAALRCKEGGLDGLETMTAGHLIGQFFSPITNKRTDDFGGSLENRCRFGLMVHEEIRRRVGDQFIVGMRYLIDETMAGGLSFDDCLEIAGCSRRRAWSISSMSTTAGSTPNWRWRPTACRAWPRRSPPGWNRPAGSSGRSRCRCSMQRGLPILPVPVMRSGKACWTWWP